MSLFKYLRRLFQQPRPPQQPADVRMRLKRYAIERDLRMAKYVSTWRAKWHRVEADRRMWRVK